MSIRARILCGFLLALSLTLGVALVGWLGLDGYGARITASSAAQSLVGSIERTITATNLAVAGGPPGAVATAVTDVRARIAALARATADQTTAGLGDRIDAYQALFNDYAAAEAGKQALRRERRAIGVVLTRAANQVSDAQAQQFASATGQFAGAALDLKSAAGVAEAEASSRTSWRRWAAPPLPARTVASTGRRRQPRSNEQPPWCCRWPTGCRSGWTSTRSAPRPPASVTR